MEGSTNQSNPIDNWIAEKSTHWPTLLLGVVAGVAVASLYTFLLKPLYEVKITLLMGRPTASPSGANLLTGQGVAPVMVLKGVAGSDRLLKEVAKAGGLSLEDTAKMFSSRADQPANQLILSAITPDRAQAEKMVTAAAATLEQLNREVGFSIGSRQAARLQEAIAMREKEKESAEDAWLEKMQAMKAPSDPSEVSSSSYYLGRKLKAEYELGTIEREIEGVRAQLRRSGQSAELPGGVLRSVELLRPDVIQAEAQYETAKKVLGESNPDLQSKQRAYEAAKNRFDREVRNAMKAVNSGLAANLVMLNSKRSLLRASRDYWAKLALVAPDDAIDAIRTQGQILGMDRSLQSLNKRLFDARLQEDVDRFQWSRLGPAQASDEPVNKNYFINGLVGGFLGLALSSVLGRRRSPQSS